MYYYDRVLKNEDGTDASENGKPATALMGIKRALISDPVGQHLSGEKKLKRFELFMKLAKLAGITDMELSVDEVALAKEAVEIYPTLVYGQLVEFLNQK